jgi:hypothetical protein
MVTSSQIQSAGEYVEWLRQQVHDRQVPATRRVRAAGACLALAQEHHHSIVFLIENQLYGSAFALARPAFEAYVRSVWLTLCAAEDGVERFLSGEEPPKIGTLLAELEQTEAFSEKVLSAIKAKSWSAMCDYTHTGGRHVHRWNTAEAIEPSYHADELAEVLRFAEVVGSLSVLGLATLAEDEQLALRVLERVKQRAA